MPISSTQRKVGPTPGNGTSRDFPFTFKVFDPSQVEVIRTSANGGDVTLTQPTDYVVTLNPDQNVQPGGTVRLSAALGVGLSLTILSAVPITQLSNWQSQGGFNPDDLDDDLDRQTAVSQQIAEQLSRTLVVPATASDEPIAMAKPKSGMLLGWSADGTRVVNIDPKALIGFGAFASSECDIFTGDGVETVFNLSVDGGSLPNLRISIAGVAQTPGVDFFWNGGTEIEFAEAPGDGLTIVVQYFAVMASSGELNAAVERAEQAAAGGENKADKDLDNAIRLRGEAMTAQQVEFNNFLDQLAATPLEFAIPEAQPALGKFNPVLSSPLQDDTDALQKMQLASGGAGAILPGVYIVRGYLAIKGGVTLQGTSTTGELMIQSQSFSDRKATIIVDTDAGGQVELDGGALDKVNVISLKAAVKPNDANAWDAYQRMQSWTGVGVRFKPQYSADNRLTNCAIVGFAQSVDIDYVERFVLANNRIDCLAGHKIGRVYDVSRIRDDYFWPLWAAHRSFYTTSAFDAQGGGAGRSTYNSQPVGFRYKDTENQVLWARVGAPGSWVDLDYEMAHRPGKFLQLGTDIGGVDGIFASGVHAYGYRGGSDKFGCDIRAGTGSSAGSGARMYASRISEFWIDGAPEAVGIACTGNVNQLFISDVHVDTHLTGVRLNHEGSVVIRGLSLGGVSYAGVQIASQAGRGIIDGIVQDGTTGHIIKVESSAGDLTVGGTPCGYTISNLWPTGAAGAMIDCGNVLARRALKVNHKTISRYRGGYDPRLFDGYGQVTLSSVQSIPGTGAATTIQFVNAVQNGLGEWGADYAHYPWEENSIYDYLLVLAFKPDTAGPGQLGVDVVRNGAKLFRAFQTTISDAELKVFSIPIRLGNGSGQKVQFQITSQVPGQLQTDFNNTRITFNRAL